MADDEMAVLLQEAIAELQASRKQTEALVRQNQQLIVQNTELAENMKKISDSTPCEVHRRQAKPKVEVAIHTKVHQLHYITGRKGRRKGEHYRTELVLLRSMHIYILFEPHSTSIGSDCFVRYL